jgi:hypothetical protein
MVVDVDEAAAVQTEETCAGNAVAFEEDSGDREIGFDLTSVGDEMDSIEPR